MQQLPKRVFQSTEKLASEMLITSWLFIHLLAENFTEIRVTALDDFNATKQLTKKMFVKRSRSNHFKGFDLIILQSVPSTLEESK